jgi:glycosyltransferase involved in cell wall biosynthesis
VIRRVCYVVDAPYAGGAERYIRYLTTGLDRLRFVPAVLVRDDAGPEIADWCTELVAAGVEVAAAPMGLPFRPTDAVGFVRALRRLRPDIVHVNMPGPYDGQMALSAPLSRLAGARAVVVTEHLPMVPPLRKREAVRRFAFAFVDRALTVCQSNAVDMERLHGVLARRIVVVANALEESYATGPRASAKREVTIAFVGNLEARKNVDGLLRALATLVDLPWHLEVAGSGPDEARCRALAGELLLSERVTWLGNVSSHEVEALLLRSQVLALVSKVEAAPYAILEAMAAGVAVVASRVHGIPEMVVDGQTGRLVSPEDSASIGRAIRELVEDESLRSQMGAIARQRFVELHTLPRQLERVQRVYDEVLGNMEPK